MPDEHKPIYRYRGHVAPSAEVSRPVQVIRLDASNGGSGSATGSAATVDIFDVIDSWGGWWGISAAEVDAALKQVGDVDTLYVRLNSPGGEATEGVAIANLLRAHKADVRVTVYGLAASAASVIAIAGDHVSMAPGSLMMIHEASVFAMGDSDTLRVASEMLEAMNDSAAALYKLKAGGDIADWRAIMKAVKWYTADAALAAKLADAVGVDPQLPAGLPPVEDEESEPDIEIEIDVEISPAARAAARRWDLSMLPDAPAALATKPPAEPLGDPSTRSKEADAMSEPIPAWLRERLELPEDADQAAATAKLDELDELATKPPEPAPAPAPVAQVPDGKILVDKAQWDDVTEQAKLGAEARAKQLVDERDTVIAQAIADGKLSRNEDNLAKLRADWDADPETTRKRIADMAVLYPVKPVEGFQGHDGTPGGNAVFSDAEAEALAQLAGTTKEALLS